MGVQWVLWVFTHMAPLGISLIAIGVALVCQVGVLQARPLTNSPTVLGAPGSFERSSMLWTKKMAAVIYDE